VFAKSSAVGHIPVSSSRVAGNRPETSRTALREKHPADVCRLSAEPPLKSSLLRASRTLFVSGCHEGSDPSAVDDSTPRAAAWTRASDNEEERKGGNVYLGTQSVGYRSITQVHEEVIFTLNWKMFL